MVTFKADDKIFSQILINIKLRNLNKLKIHDKIFLDFVTKKAFSKDLLINQDKLLLKIPVNLREEIKEFSDYQESINCIQKVLSILDSVKNLLNDIENDSNTILINNLLAFYLNIDAKSFLKIRLEYNLLKNDNSKVTSDEVLASLISQYK